uniref:Inner nuclear membrane protein Man1-like n=1 Tax=Phallusia mammillata TaxID=59560 RepID=A0A6F9DIW6_9ASCI|nr:inner nuclear membrane protein Man1-like [Phallusia mammillata]
MTSLNLSDRELRQELLSLGEKVGPITSSTRNLYIKRLTKIRNLLNEDIPLTVESNSKNGNQQNLKKLKQTKIKPQRKTFGFSSDESDNNEDTARRQTSGMSLRRRSHQPTMKLLTSKSLPSTPSRKPMHKNVLGLIPGNRSVKKSPVVTNGYSDDSDEEENSSWSEVLTADISTSPLPSYNSSPVKSSLTPRRPLRKSRASLDATPLRSARKNQFDDEHDIHDDRTDIGNGSAIVSQVEENSAEERVKLGYDATTQRQSSKTQTITQENSNPFLHLWRKVSKNNDSVKHSESNGFVQTERPSQQWHLHCSALLPIGTIVFFVVLGLLYVTLRSDEAIIPKPALPHHPTSTDDHNIMEVIHQIYQELASKAGEFVCNSQVTSDLVSVSRLKSLIKLDDLEFLKALQLIQDNPEWRLNMYIDEKGRSANGISLTEVTHMSSDLPILPTFCRFRRAVEKVVVRVGAVLAVGLMLWLVIMYRQYRTRKLAEERQTMFVLVEKILDILKSHHESSENDETIKPYLPILHARDMIIQPQERRKLKKVWEKAVHFISASESRIRVETQRVSGEDFLVWRWIQVTSPCKRQHPPGRVWQGEAFDTNKSINTPAISPTPCLKIRNMFHPDVEKADDWHIQIQDSILEKCSDNNEIASVIVEKKSTEGLVYVKCLSCAAAGKVYRSLHGSWFDGRLVTVKFIKLSRFHAHYPGSVGHNTPLKPTSSRQVSTFLPSTPTSGPLTSTPVKHS